MQNISAHFIDMQRAVFFGLAVVCLRPRTLMIAADNTQTCLA